MPKKNRESGRGGAAKKGSRRAPELLAPKQFSIAQCLQTEPLSRQQLVDALRDDGQPCSPSAMHQTLRRLHDRGMIQETTGVKLYGKKQKVKFHLYHLTDPGKEAYLNTIAFHVAKCGVTMDRLVALAEGARRGVL